MKYNEQLLADITGAMYQHSGVMCDLTYRIEVAKLLVDSIEGEDTPSDVIGFSGHILPTQTWDGFSVKIADCIYTWGVEVFCGSNIVGGAVIPDDEMSIIIRRVESEKAYTNETYLAEVVKAIRWYMNAQPNEDKDVAVWNDYVGYTGDGDTIYSSLSDLARDFYAHDPAELARAMFFGDLKAWDDYVYINGYGNICSIEDLGEHISYDNLALWLYSQGRVEVRVNVQAGEPGEETWDVEIEGTNVSLDDIIERVKHELQHEIEIGDVVLDPATWLIDIDVLEIK